jgi:Ca2+-binding RTX toxin-like protein
LTGGGGDDVLDGKGGGDRMNGGDGNDLYFVDNASDVITDAAGGGIDEVRTSVSYTLAGTSEIEKITAIGDGAINLTGNAIAQTITGNAAANVLAGLGGNDTLTGGAGNDTFLFNAGGGKDVITDFETGDILKVDGYTSAQSITQSGSDVVIVLTSADQITLQNTDVATVQAGIQFDTGTGGGTGGGGGTPGGPSEGDDTLTGTTRGDTINGLGGNDTILGLAGSDKLLGGDGNDVLRGGAGADTLTGGAGADLFVFEAGGNNDKVTDFVSGVDKIDLHLLSGVSSADIKTALNNGNTIISVDTTHDGRADFTITLTGVSHVDAGDFIFA